MASDLSVLSLSGVVAAVILLTGDYCGEGGWREFAIQAATAVSWLAVLGTIRGLGVYGSWFIVPGTAVVDSPLPFLASPSGTLLLSSALLFCIYVIYERGWLKSCMEAADGMIQGKSDKN